MNKRTLSQITESEALEVAKILLPIGYDWTVSTYEDFYKDPDLLHGLRIHCKRNIFSVDFDFEFEDVCLKNEDEENDVYLNAEKQFKIVGKLNEMGIFLKWQK